MNRYEILKGKFPEEDIQEVEDSSFSNIIRFDSVDKLVDYLALHEGEWSPADNPLNRTIGFVDKSGNYIYMNMTDYKKTMYLLPGHIQKCLHFYPLRKSLPAMLRKRKKK